MNVYTIYTFTNRITGKKYVGYTGRGFDRISTHKHSLKKGKKSKFYDAVRSYDWDNFEFEIIYQSKDKNHTKNVMENYFIQQYNSIKNGYNMTYGGDGQDSDYLRKLWNKEKRQELSNKWTDDMKNAQKEKSKSIWKSMIDNGYKVKANETFLVCPHCKKTNNLGNSKRWHFDNCKYKMIGD